MDQIAHSIPRVLKSTSIGAPFCAIDFCLRSTLGPTHPARSLPHLPFFRGTAGQTSQNTPRSTYHLKLLGQARLGEEAGQGIRIIGTNNRSHLSPCIEASTQFHLSVQEAIAIILVQVNAIRTHWDRICDETNLSAVDRALLYGRQFLNPFAFYDAPQEIRSASQL